MGEPTHFSDGREIPQTFCFMFPDGPVWEKDMTREQLLLVIQHLMGEREYWKGEVMKPKYWWQK